MVTYILYSIFIVFIATYLRRRNEKIEYRIKKLEDLHKITGDEDNVTHMTKRTHPGGYSDAETRIGGAWKKFKEPGRVQ
jgi:hypothetical protein